jgi:hypothetical protein
MKTNEKSLREKGYQLLAECIRSDQLSARQVVAEFEADKEFYQWYKEKYNGNKTI